LVDADNVECHDQDPNDQFLGIECTWVPYAVAGTRRRLNLNDRYLDSGVARVRQGQ
jgi:hypothetical protein